MIGIGVGIGIGKRKNIPWNAYWNTHGKTSTGKLLVSDFDDISGWTNDGTFTKVADDALVCFDPLPLIFSGTINGGDRTGVRESFVMVEGSTMYLTYVGGDNSTGWYVQLAHSTDGGKSWTKDGIIGPPRDDAEAGTFPAVDNLTWYKEDGVYYMYRMTSDNVGPAPYNDVCYGPFRSDIWTASSFAGPWTFIGKTDGVPASSWAKDRILAGGIIKVGSTYYFFVQGSGSTTDYFPLYFGIWTGNTPIGPWTILDPPFMSTVILDDERLPENPRPWYHPTLNKYCCVGNISTPPSPFFAAQNSLQISSDVLFTTSSLRRIQMNTAPIDTPNGRTMGLMCPVMTDENEVIIGNNGLMPVTFDSDGLIQSIEYHVGKCIKFNLLEPSRNALRFDGSATGSIYKALAHTDFVAEFGVQFDSYTGGELASFLFRADGTGDNQYYMHVQNGNNEMVLVKDVDGVGTVVETSTATGRTVLEMINRIKIVAIGSSIKGYLNGQLQINSVDTDLASGTHIGFMGQKGANTDLRLLNIRSSDTVTLNDLPVGVDVDLMADGGIVAKTTISNYSGTAHFTLNHWPMDAFRINGRTYTVSGGIYGGDVYSFGGISITGFTLSPSLGSTKLLLHLNNNITDSSLVPQTVTNVGSVTFATVNGRFGYYAEFAAGKYLTIPDFDGLDFGANDFTLDCWIYPTTLSGSDWYFFCGQGNAPLDAATRQLSVFIEGTTSVRKLGFVVFDSASNQLQSSRGITTFIVNNWYHIAVVRYGNTAIGYLNGRAECYLDLTGVTLQHGTGTFALGRMGLYSSSPFIGRIDEFRLTKGVARWTRDFTPELVEYDPDI